MEHMALWIQLIKKQIKDRFFIIIFLLQSKVFKLLKGMTSELNIPVTPIPNALSYFRGIFRMGSSDDDFVNTIPAVKMVSRVPNFSR